jgi:ribosomal protein L16 Arg81 hydroxylase
MNERSSSLEHLLQPIGLEDFLARYYERDSLVIHRDTPSHYDGLLPLAAIDDMVGATSLTSDEILVVDHARDIQREDYLREDETPDPLRIYKLFDEGATITLRQLQHRVPALARLCRSAERQFSCSFQTNLYFTPANAQGFQTHHDTHDVFILQLAGSKRWQTYEPAVQLPLPGQRYYWSTPPDPPVKDFILHAGDLFYCPRGTPHDAHAAQEASVHISLGALVSTWAELLLEMVADVALRDPAFRASLPPDYAQHDIAPEILDRTLSDLYSRLRAQGRPRHILGLMADRFISDHPALLTGQESTLRAAASLTLDSTVSARAGLIHRVAARRGKVVLICNRRQIALPDCCGPALKFALAGAPFRVRELPGALSDSGKIAFVRRLMQEGALVSVTTIRDGAGG